MHATYDEATVQFSVENFLCGAFLAVMESACQSPYPALSFLRAEDLPCFQDFSMDIRPHVSIFLSKEVHRLQAETWISSTTQTWKFYCDGFLQRISDCDTSQAESKTIISFFVKMDGPPFVNVLVVSCDSDCPSITLLNADLRHHKDFHRV